MTIIIIMMIQVTFKLSVYEERNPCQMSMWHCVRPCAIGILDRIDICAYTFIKAVPLSTL